MPHTKYLRQIKKDIDDTKMKEPKKYNEEEEVLRNARNRIRKIKNR